MSSLLSGANPHMNRSILQKLARLRIADARMLLRAGRYQGAYYLAGYAVECALKACIAKQTARYDFPDRRRVEKSHTHDLAQLLDLSGLKAEFDKVTAVDRSLELSWSVAKDWSEASRYSLTISKAEAADLYSAVAGRKHGVLRWLTMRW